MKLSINGQERDLPPIGTLAELLRAIDLDPEVPGIAVARNGQVIPRRDYAGTSVAEGDRIEVVRAVQGG